MIKRACIKCNTEFFTFPCRIKNGSGKFCSPSCAQRSKKLSKETKRKIGIAHLSERNPMWKGNQVGYSALHEWVKNRLVKTPLCQECNLVPPYDLANISQEYTRDLSDWEWLCRHCHMTKDGRLNNLHQNKTTP